MLQWPVEFVMTTSRLAVCGRSPSGSACGCSLGGFDSGEDRRPAPEARRGRRPARRNKIGESWWRFNAAAGEGARGRAGHGGDSAKANPGRPGEGESGSWPVEFCESFVRPLLYFPFSFLLLFFTFLDPVRTDGFFDLFWSSCQKNNDDRLFLLLGDAVW
jgi:hypothetical protein